MRYRLLAVACLAALFWACDESPVEPANGEVVRLQTAWGPVAVETNGYPLDRDALLLAIDRGYAMARAQIGERADAVSLRGFVVAIVDPSTLPGAYGNYVRLYDMAHCRPGGEAVIAHELMHRFAHELGLPCAGATIDHPGGYDLNCVRRG